MVSFPVPAGQHTLEWSYNKDVSVSNGSDAAWIDDIVFPALAPFVSVEDSPVKQQADFYILPNPAREHAELFIQLPSASSVTVAIYDLTGNKIMEAVSDRMLSAGSNRISLETTGLTSGMYFCVMNNSGQRVTRKLIISK